MRLLLSLALASAAAPALAAAPNFQDTVALDHAVTGFTGRAIGEDGGARAAVDARLKLAACPMVTMAWRADNHDSVVINCTGPAWRIFVPIVKATSGAPTAAAPVSAAAPLKPVTVIKRGDPVTIAASSTGFSITREGVAMADASAGGRFLVKVDDTKAPVQAVASEAGRATLPGWQE